jgi:tetratricopeptide (TPR) repeat protein
VTADPRVPGYLGRVLDSSGMPVGTCFQVSAGVLVTAWHVLDDLGAGEVDAVVTVDALAGGLAAGRARVARIDPVHDLAVLHTGVPFDATVAGLAVSDGVALSTGVAVAGVSEVNDPGRTFRWLVADGVWKIGTTRDDAVPLGRFTSTDVVPGMSGGPVRRVADDLVVGVVSGRYNTADGWLAGTVWVARVEELLPLLDGLAQPVVRGRWELAERLDLVLHVGPAETRLSGGGIEVAAAHAGVSHALVDAVDRLRRARVHLSGLRGSDTLPTAAPAAAVGRLLAAQFLPEPVADELRAALAAARARHVALTVGVTVDGVLGSLPWEALWLDGSPGPLALDDLVRLYRRTPAARVVVTAGPLRILVAISSPVEGGSGVLDYERELRNVLKAVRGARAGHAEVRIVRFATTAAIKAALTEWPAHVLHLSGHGGPGVFELEDERGLARPVTATEFIAEAIPAGAMPPVVALAGCHTNVATATGDPSFAGTLLAHGAGVVVATQTAITDIYSTRIFARLYGHLAATREPDLVAAVAQARIAVQRELADSDDPRDALIADLDEWAVLCVQAAGGTVPLLDPTAPALPAAEPIAVSAVLRRETGEVVGRRWEQRRYPEQLLAAGCAGLVLHGLGGVGKTTLADELILRLAETAPGMVVALVENQTTADRLLDAVIEACGEALQQSRPPAWASEAVLRALARAHDGDLAARQRVAILTRHVLPAVAVLLVLDNFEDNLSTDATTVRTVVDPDLADLLATLAAAPGRARLLITSRYRFTLPGGADQVLSFKPILPLSYAETMKLAWALPNLDRLDGTTLEQLWRAVGGHPRCLEYLDALLAGGHARFTDVRLRLVGHVTKRLHDLGRPAAEVQRYLTQHLTLDSAIAEAASLAADDILLDHLHHQLATVPRAVDLLLGVSVYRVPVDLNALRFQLGEPDATAATTDAWRTAQRHIADILTAAGILTGPVHLNELPAAVRARLAPHLAVRLTPPVRIDADLTAALAACTASSLITTDSAESTFFVHRWTATELHRRHTAAELIAAHRRAAQYWQWRIDHLPQPPARKADDLREAHHHYQHMFLLGDPDALAQLASAAHRLDQRLGNLGRRTEALIYAEQAVDLTRQLAERDEPTYIQNLAGFTSNLGLALSNLGRRQEALTATSEAVDTFRRLAALDVHRFERNLAMSLANLGMMLSNLGRREEALAATTEAVEVYRRLAAADPAVFEPDLAKSLNNLGATLSNLGQREEALAATTEAVKVRRRLAATNPTAFEPNLATSLNNLGTMLSNLGQRGEALAATTEAVEVYRRLAATNPAAFEPDLATSLNNLGTMLSDLGRREEALAAATEAVKVHQRLTTTNPAAFEPDLATSLNNLGIRLANMGRGQEARAACHESVELWRRLAAGHHEAHFSGLANALWNVGYVAVILDEPSDHAIAMTAEGVHHSPSSLPSFPPRSPPDATLQPQHSPNCKPPGNGQRTKQDPRTPTPPDHALRVAATSANWAAPTSAEGGAACPGQALAEKVHRVEGKPAVMCPQDLFRLTLDSDRVREPYTPVRPSIRCRSRSAWPLCRAYSSIM